MKKWHEGCIGKSVTQKRYRQTAESGKNMMITYIRTTWLFIFHLITLRSLKVSGVGSQREVIYGNTRTRIQWQAQGCHRISIDGRRSFWGSISGVSIREQAQPQVVVVRFHGCFDTKELIVNIPEENIEFFKQFDSKKYLGDSLFRHKIAQSELGLKLAAQPLQVYQDINLVDFFIKLDLMTPTSKQ